MLDLTVSADGIHSLVAGFPLQEAWRSAASGSSDSLNEAPLSLSILMKPVPVCSRGDISTDKGKKC